MDSKSSLVASYCLLCIAVSLGSLVTAYTVLATPAWLLSFEPILQTSGGAFQISGEGLPLGMLIELVRTVLYCGVLYFILIEIYDFDKVDQELAILDRELATPVPEGPEGNDDVDAEDEPWKPIFRRDLAWPQQAKLFLFGPGKLGSLTALFVLTFLGVLHLWFFPNSATLDDLELDFDGHRDVPMSPLEVQFPELLLGGCENGEPGPRGQRYAPECVFEKACQEGYFVPRSVCGGSIHPTGTRRPYAAYLPYSIVNFVLLWIPFIAHSAVILRRCRLGVRRLAAIRWDDDSASVKLPGLTFVRALREFALTSLNILGWCFLSILIVFLYEMTLGWSTLSALATAFMLIFVAMSLYVFIFFVGLLSVLENYKRRLLAAIGEDDSPELQREIERLDPDDILADRQNLWVWRLLALLLQMGRKLTGQS